MRTVLSVKILEHLLKRFFPARNRKRHAFSRCGGLRYCFKLTLRMWIVKMSGAHAQHKVSASVGGWIK